MKETLGVFKNSRILLIGGTGFIGTRLVEILKGECGARVGVLVRNLKNASRVARFEVDLLPGDIGDLESLMSATRGCDIVFNLAYDFGAKTDKKRSTAITGAENVAKAVHKNKIGRLVHFGTISSYGDTKPGILTENTVPEPTEDLYGLSKRDADEVFLRWFREKGLPVAIIEPTIVYGPYSKPWTHGPLAQLTTGVVVLPNSGKGLCNAVYIDDVIQGALLAATHPLAIGQKFLISAGKPVTWMSFYGAYEKMLGYEATALLEENTIRGLEGNPKNLGKFITDTGDVPKKRFGWPWSSSRNEKNVHPLSGLAEDVESGMITLHLPNQVRLGLLNSQTEVDIDKARRVLGFSPRYDLSSGMEMTERYARWADLLKPGPGGLNVSSGSTTASGVITSAKETLGLQRLISNREKLVALKNRYAGRRCFIIGNGPSLKKTNLSLLKDEITIGCNGLFLMYAQMGFEPTFYTVEDTLVAEDRAEVINRLRGSTKVFPADLHYCLRADAQTIYVNFFRPGYKGFPKFSDTFEDHAYWGGTVTFFNLQLAYFLGCTEIYLVGVDHSYRDKNKEDEQERLTITARTDDPNHFHPDYFGPGFRYHVPNVERMEVGYRKANEFLTKTGVKVCNATKGGQLEVFRRIDYDTLLRSRDAIGVKND